MRRPEQRRGAVGPRGVDVDALLRGARATAALILSATACTSRRSGSAAAARGRRQNQERPSDRPGAHERPPIRRPRALSVDHRADESPTAGCRSVRKKATKYRKPGMPPDEPALAIIGRICWERCASTSSESCMAAGLRRASLPHGWRCRAGVRIDAAGRPRRRRAQTGSASIVRGRCSISTASAVTTNGSRRGELCSTGVDLSRRRHATPPILEKVVRKLRSGTDAARGAAAAGQGRRSTRSSRRSRRRSIAHAAAAPNPGRVASRRLNRAEYVNVDPRSARPGSRRHGAAAERHGRLRLRQQRRCAVDHARR